MSGLEEQFAERVDFILLDWDDPTLDAQRAELGITGRTQYVLVDSAGNILMRWFGSLNEAIITDQINALISG